MGGDGAIGVKQGTAAQRPSCCTSGDTWQRPVPRKDHSHCLACCRACDAFLATGRVKTVAVWRGRWLAVRGVVAQELDLSSKPGPLLSDAMARETANSISNLPLFPGTKV